MSVANLTEHGGFYVVGTTPTITYKKNSVLFCPHHPLLDPILMHEILIHGLIVELTIISLWIKVASLIKKNSEQYDWEERASQLRRKVAKRYWIKEASVWERACRSDKQKLGTCVCSERHREPNQPHAMILLLRRFTLQILRPNAISKGPGDPKKFTHEKTNQHKESIIPIPTLSITDF